MGLRFVAHAAGHSKTLANLDVVLEVDPALSVGVLDAGIAGAARVAAGPPGLERLEAFEHVSAEVVALRIRTERAVLDLDTRPHRVHAAHVVEIGIQPVVPTVRSAASLCAPAREVLDHFDRRQFDGRPCLRVIARSPRGACSARNGGRSGRSAGGTCRTNSARSRTRASGDRRCRHPGWPYRTASR